MMPSMSARAARSHNAPKSGLPRKSTTVMPRYVLRVRLPTFPVLYLSDGGQATTMRERAKEYLDRTEAVEELQSLNATWVAHGEVYP